MKDGPQEFDLKVYVFLPSPSLHYILICGLISVHGGRATGKRTWPAVEGNVFTQDVMHSFTRYLMQTPGAFSEFISIPGDTNSLS